MLSSISPLGERARGARWSVVTTAYILSSLLAGALVGLLLGGLGSLLPHGLLTHPVVLLTMAALLVLGAVLDTRAGGHAVPSWHRQVDEGWIGTYRGWVTGTGFGFQLGLGVVTIITSTTTYAVLLLELLTGSWWAGALVGATFGLVRALPLLLVRGVQTPQALHDTFRRLTTWAAPVATLARAVLLLAGAALTAIALTG